MRKYDQKLTVVNKQPFILQEQQIVLYFLIMDSGKNLDIESLDENDFLDENLRQHFVNMRDLSRKNLKYDLHTYLCEYASGPTNLDFLNVPTQWLPSLSNFDFYVTQLRKHTYEERCRRIYLNFQNATDKAEARTAMNLELERLDRSSHEKSVSLAEIASLMHEELDFKRQNPDVTLLRSNLPFLDKFLSTINGPYLFVIGARPGIGKSAFGLQLAWESAGFDKRVGFISLELSLPIIAMRLTSYSKKINLTHLVAGKENVIDEYYQYPLDVERKIYFEKPADRSIENIIKRIYVLAKKDKVDFIVIDHLRNITGDLKGSEEHRVLRGMLEKLYDASHTLKLPLVILTQLRRDCEYGNSHPKLNWLQGSSAIEQYADGCLFLYSLGEDPVEAEYEINFRLMKARSTLKMKLPTIEFNGPYQTFREKIDKPLVDVFTRRSTGNN